jgi:hypothetical protein
MTHRLAHLAAGLAVVTATCLATTGTAAAAEPERSTFEVDDTFPSRTSEECGFDILLRLEGTIVVTDFFEQDGSLARTLVTYPGLFYTFINAATGESVTSRSPDPEHYRWNADGSLTLTVTGLVLHLGGPGGQAVQAGRFVVTVDAEGEETVTEPVGSHDDYHAALCEILAP